MILFVIYLDIRYISFLHDRKPLLLQSHDDHTRGLSLLHRQTACWLPPGQRSRCGSVWRPANFSQSSLKTAAACLKEDSILDRSTRRPKQRDQVCQTTNCRAFAVALRSPWPVATMRRQPMLGNTARQADQRPLFDA